MSRFFVTTIWAIIFFIAGCGGNAGDDFTEANQLAIDSTNDRLFVTEAGGNLFAYEASSQVKIGTQPIIDEDEDDDDAIFALMPEITSNFVTYTTGTTSRLFLMGNFVNDAGATVLNRIRVLDFDGSDFSETSFSPIDLSDGDDTTDESNNSFADMILDQSNSDIYITDTGAGLLYVISADDGSQVVAPIVIAGEPQGMSLTDGRLYVCNSSATESEQLVTVVNVSDFSTTTIDLDIPCTQIAAQSNGTGVVLFAKNSDTQQVLVRTVDTTTFAASTSISAVDSEDIDFNDGELVSDKGVTSSISGIVLTKDSSGNFYGYLSEVDGNVEYVTIPSTFDSYTLETLTSSAASITKGEVYVDSSGNGEQVYFVSEVGALVSVEVGSDDLSVDD